MSDAADSRITYASYLKIPELLGLQDTLTDAHDELQFIVVHQAFELWFKLTLFELESLRECLSRADARQGIHRLRRVRKIMRMLTGSFEVIETMRPYDFLQFREKLMPASGLQSLQFREIEFICGLKDERYLKLASGHAASTLQKRMAEPTLWDAYLRSLEHHGIDTGSDEAIVEGVIGIMKDPDDHPLGPLTEALIDLDELFSLWRSRHIQMTMRMIGAKPGTGETDVKELGKAGYAHMGPGGVDYLRSTLSKVFFPLLWEARTFINR